MYYKAMVIKTAWFGHKGRQAEYLHRVENPETNPYIYSHLIYNKVDNSVE